LRLQRLAEERHGLEALDPAQPRLDVEERGGQPAVFLVCGPPVIDFNTRVFLRFLHRLLRHVRGVVFLIVDRHRVDLGTVK
jgi:hypothetical protein